MKRVLLTLGSIFSLTQIAAGPITWGTPSTISTSGISASSQQVATSPTGRSIAVWVENGFIQTAVIPSGGSWGPITTISGAGASASSPQVAMDPSGNATAVWVENTLIKVSQLPAGGSWGATTTLSATSASSPTLDVDDSGNVVVAWAVSGGVYSKTLLSGGSWPILPDTLALIGSSPKVAAKGGRASAVWQQTVGSVPTIFASNKVINGLWAVGSVISTSGINSIKPNLSVDSNGNTAATWFSYSLSNTVYSNVIVEAAYLPLGGSWTTPSSISDTGFVNPNSLNSVVSIDDLGNVFALWNTSLDGSSYIAEANLMPVNKSWQFPSDLNVPNLVTYGVSSASDPSGFAVCLWQNYDPSSGNITIQTSQTPTKSNGLFFDVPFDISLSSPNTSPTVDCRGNGVISNAIASWLYFDGTNFNVQTAIGSGPVIVPITNLTGSQTTTNLGVTSEITTNLSWTASVDSRVVGYKVYRDGFFITSLPTSQTTYSDPNRVQGVSNTYGIGAFDPTGFQSTTVFVTTP